MLNKFLCAYAMTCFIYYIIDIYSLFIYNIVQCVTVALRDKDNLLK